MKLTRVDFNEVKKAYKNTKLLTVLEEFQNSDFECAKLEDWEYKNADSGVASFNNAIEHFKFVNIKAVSRNGNIYLIKKELLNERTANK